jgi:hypothetical protein
MRERVEDAKKPQVLRGGDGVGASKPLEDSDVVRRRWQIVVEGQGLR